jgi:HD-GYP domain-containing protein (c-di-GMP phosphodiesterase class II)
MIDEVKHLKNENERLLEELEEVYEQLQTTVIDSVTERDIIYAELREKIQKYQQLFLGTLKVLTSAIEAKDPYTRGHSSRVNEYSKAIGVELGLSEEQLEFLQYAALLHDVGKIGIDEKILRKPGKLEKMEWGTVKEHPLMGARLIEPIELFSRILPFVIHHHEAFDGDGYPRGLRGSEIPFEARIIAVADAFDAMTSDRPYRKAYSDNAALEELKEKAGIQFDPMVVEAFLAVIQKKKIVFKKNR